MLTAWLMNLANSINELVSMFYNVIEKLVSHFCHFQYLFNERTIIVT